MVSPDTPRYPGEYYPSIGAPLPPSPPIEQFFPPLSECSNPFVLVSHEEVWGTVKPYFMIGTMGVNAAPKPRPFDGIIPSTVFGGSAIRKTQYYFNFATGEWETKQKDSYDAKAWFMGINYSQDIDTGKSSTSPFVAGSVFKVAKLKAKANRETVSLEASISDPAGFSSIGGGGDFSNSRNIDLTAVRYRDAEQNGGVQAWVSKLRGIPMRTVIGFGDTLEVLRDVASDEGYFCRLIHGFAITENNIRYGRTHVSTKYCQWTPEHSGGTLLIPETLDHFIEPGGFGSYVITPPYPPPLNENK